MYVYDNRRIFWPTGVSSAKLVPIEIDSSGKISKASNVQDAIQVISDEISCALNDIPKNLNRDKSTLRETIDCVNKILDMLRELRTISNGKVDAP